MTGIQIVLDDEGRYCGIEIRCHVNHKHFITTLWAPHDKVRSPFYPEDPQRAWGFNGDFVNPTVTPSVKTRAGHYARPDNKRGECYCDFSERHPDKEPMAEGWTCYLCHFVLSNGVMQYCSDCTHEFKGMNIPLYDTQVKPTMPHPNQNHRERLPARFIRKIRSDAFWRVYWWDKIVKCTDGDYFHQGMKFLDWSGNINDRSFANHRENILAECPIGCDKCGLVVPCTYDDRFQNDYKSGKGASFHIFYKDRYNTDSGEPEPGDIYYEDLCLRLRDEDDQPNHCHQTRNPWINCDGHHLTAILPNGRTWDIDSRCRNCTLPEDREHRCWVRHGLPELGELITVDKNGRTCSAGGGSIDVPGWHGFLRHGEFVR